MYIISPFVMTCISMFSCFLMSTCAMNRPLVLSVITYSTTSLVAWRLTEPIPHAHYISTSFDSLHIHPTPTQWSKVQKIYLTSTIKDWKILKKKVWLFQFSRSFLNQSQSIQSKKRVPSHARRITLIKKMSSSATPALKSHKIQFLTQTRPEWFLESCNQEVQLKWKCDHANCKGPQEPLGNSPRSPQQIKFMHQAYQQQKWFWNFNSSPQCFLFFHEIIKIIVIQKKPDVSYCHPLVSKSIHLPVVFIYFLKPHLGQIVSIFSLFFRHLAGPIKSPQSSFPFLPLLELQFRNLENGTTNEDWLTYALAPNWNEFFSLLVLQASHKLQHIQLSNSLLSQQAKSIQKQEGQITTSKTIMARIASKISSCHGQKTIRQNEILASQHNSMWILGILFAAKELKTFTSKCEINCKLLSGSKLNNIK
ncbi:putative signal peptide protein [Puccinia sorghi]|uniref:Putative signal peptide protein n=1 Tax=Puccinia sorghi TaxID=27349 RepID=A0A0L6UH76_9BASI|nr:putative signal peptide protein [Puccinia sorghi]